MDTGNSTFNRDGQKGLHVFGSARPAVIDAVIVPIPPAFADLLIKVVRH